MSLVQNTNQSQKLLHVNSEELPYYAFNIPGITTDVNVELDQAISCFTNEHLAVSIHSLSLPSSWYNISQFDNTFEFKVSAGSYQTLTVSPGNYNTRQLANEVQTLLNNLSLGTFSVSYNSITNHFTIVETSSTTQFSLLFTGSNTIHKQLGFAKAEYSSSMFLVESVNAVSIFPYQSIYLHLNLVAGDSQDSFGRAVDIFERIGIPPSNQLVFWRPIATSQRYLINRRYLTNFRFYLTFQADGTPVDLNGLHFSFSLQFTTVHGLGRTVPNVERPLPSQFIPQVVKDFEDQGVDSGEGAVE